MRGEKGGEQESGGKEDVGVGVGVTYKTISRRQHSTNFPLARADMEPSLFYSKHPKPAKENTVETQPRVSRTCNCAIFAADMPALSSKVVGPTNQPARESASRSARQPVWVVTDTHGRARR